MDIILTVVIAGFSLNFTLMLVMWQGLNHRIDRLDARMDKFDEKLTDIDRRLCRVEGILSTKDCCMIKDDRSHRVAE